MTIHPRLASIATAVPPHVLRQQDVVAGATQLFAGSYRDWARLTPVYANAEIDTRYSCVPIDWYQQAHGFGERNRLFVENALVLLERAAREALDKAGLAAADIDGIVTVCTSGIATPALDAQLMERLPFRRDVMRLPIFGLGCAGGLLGLSRTALLARAEPHKKYLYLVVELCGLTFRHADRTKSNIIATALFGDGAAAAVIGCGLQGPALGAAAEHTWPDTLDIMGWDVRDDGLAVVLSRDLPTFVRKYAAEPAERFLSGNDLTFADIDRFVSHPGGAKVLEALEECFGLAPGGLADSRAILREYGNMSAATVMFVLQRALASGQKGRYLLSTMGPGFTAGYMLMDVE
jgi:alkylresorcinol/alkylpyrone synthase